MALSSTLIQECNPLRVTGTPMPANLLLMCKVLAVALLVTGHIWTSPGLPEPFLPFIDALDQLDPAIFRQTLRWTATIAAVALLLNRWVRFSAIILGGCLLLGVISSKAYYGNNKTFVGLALVLAGISDRDRPAYLLRWQLALVYFGAALNKLFDPDWRSGLFFDYWAGTKLGNPVYLWAANLLPTLIAGKIMCWGTMVAEFIASFGLLVPRFVPLALWCNVLFQVGLLEFTGTTFTLFFYGMQAITLAFVTWPESTKDFAAVHIAVGRGGKLLSTYGNLGWRLFYSPAWWLLLTVLLALSQSTTSRRILVAVVLAYCISILAVSFRRTRPEESVNK